MPLLPPYMPRTYLVHLAGSRRPLYCSILPKLSRAQLMAIAGELAEAGLVIGRRGERLIVKKRGEQFALEPTGIVIGGADPLQALPELFAAASKLRRRWTGKVVGGEEMRAWANGYLRAMASGREGRIVLAPRLERGGSAWVRNRGEYDCLLLPDELLVLSFTISKLRPRYVELLSYRPLARARPKIMHGRLFFINEVGYARASRLLREQAALYPERSEPHIVPPPSLILRLRRPRPFTLVPAELKELWDALGRWCLDAAALLGSRW